MSIRKIDGVVIDADTIDGKNAELAANQVPVLDAAAKLPLANLADAVCSETEAAAIALAALPQVALEATVPYFQANPATGDMSNPENMNNNNTGDSADGLEIGKYAEVDFGKLVKIKRWRQFGDTGNTGADGVYTIQYYDNLDTEQWVDWVTDMPTRGTANWSEFETEAEVVTSKIKVIVTTLDHGFGNRLAELEVIF